VREAIASAVESRGGFEGTRVLDLFAGTGAMAIEALSRGAASATLVEQDRGAAHAIEESLDALGLRDRARVLVLDASRVPASLEGSFDRVLVDPPYAHAADVPVLLDALADAGRLAAEALVVVEHPSELAMTLGARFEPLTAKRYGDTRVLIARIMR
jgi:16S rRNA (guanine966-N2)-methyltransferase